jgi:hypothetical protein
MRANGWQAFRRGLALSLHYWQILLILYAINVLSALLLSILPAWSLAAELGHRPAIREAADGVDAWLVLETMVSPLTGTALMQNSGESDLSPGLGQALLVGLLVSALLPLMAWLPSAFLSGGLLLTYVDAVREGSGPFSWHRFLWSCWHWWGAFLLLGLVQGIALVVLGVPLLAGGVIAVLVVGEWVAWVLAPLLGLILLLGLMVVEWTRVLAVVGETRNLLQAFGQAVRLVSRQPLPVIGLYGFSLLLVAALHLVYRLGLMPVVPLDWWPVVLLVQQTFVLARLETRLSRLAGVVALAVRKA